MQNKFKGKPQYNFCLNPPISSQPNIISTYFTSTQKTHVRVMGEINDKSYQPKKPMILWCCQSDRKRGKLYWVRSRKS